MTRLNLQLILLPAVLASFMIQSCSHAPSSNNNPSYDVQSSNSHESGDVDSARVHTELGAEYFRMQRYDVALEEFNTALEKSPTYALAYNGLGLVQSALGDKVRAEAAFQKAVQLQPNNSESHNNYGRFLCDQGRFEASVKEFMLAVKNPLYKTPQFAYYNAGVCSMRNQQLPQAENYFNKALQIDPQSHASTYQLANLQFKRGDAAQAYSTLQNSVNAAPTPESLFLAVRICRSLKMDNEVRSYSVQLHKLYPNAKETKQLLNME